jgi:hypothetical protein
MRLSDSAAIDEGERARRGRRLALPQPADATGVQRGGCAQNSPNARTATDRGVTTGHPGVAVLQDTRTSTNAMLITLEQTPQALFRQIEYHVP